MSRAGREWAGSRMGREPSGGTSGRPFVPPAHRHSTPPFLTSNIAGCAPLLVPLAAATTRCDCTWRGGRAGHARPALARCARTAEARPPLPPPPPWVWADVGCGWPSGRHDGRRGRIAGPAGRHPRRQPLWWRSRGGGGRVGGGVGNPTPAATPLAAILCCHRLPGVAPSVTGVGDAVGGAGCGRPLPRLPRRAFVVNDGEKEKGGLSNGSVENKIKRQPRRQHPRAAPPRSPPWRPHFGWRGGSSPSRGRSGRRGGTAYLSFLVM